WNRKSSLRAPLRARANEIDFVGAYKRLDRDAECARHLSPFALHARILVTERGRARSYAPPHRHQTDPPDQPLDLPPLNAAGAARAGVRRVAARGPDRGEARHGYGTRRGPRDDAARR